MSYDFVHQGLGGRVIFAPGARARLATETDRLGLRRLLVVCTPGNAELAADVARPLGAALVDVYAHATMHVPARVAADAVSRAEALHADGCIAIGGGSAIGLGKAVAKDTGIPLIAVPTTYAGSEMTPIWGITDGGRKRTGRDVTVLPATVIYDPELTLSLPTSRSVTSAINALAHAAESMYAPDRSPITDLIAAESARAIVAALPLVATAPRDVPARTELLYGSWLAGMALGATTMSLHHQLCHVLGGTFNLPHAETHAAVLPHVLRLNLAAAPDAEKQLRSAFGADDPAAHLFHLTQDLGAQMSLAALGMPPDGVATVIDQATSAPYANPTPVTAAALQILLADATAGSPPRPIRQHSHLN
ncbi:MAG: maleylacetate reductase [Mycobacterium sp.]